MVIHDSHVDIKKWEEQFRFGAVHLKGDALTNIDTVATALVT